ncbi:unnamed protein product [Linum trigynum]|uniref:Retrotransposon gag domain-containing protein n=1 Tax=Linum trigynum TaxID=586398 RepID=A0AAV2E079_9ROSI
MNTQGSPSIPTIEAVRRSLRVIETGGNPTPRSPLSDAPSPNTEPRVVPLAHNTSIPASEAIPTPTPTQVREMQVEIERLRAQLKAKEASQINAPGSSRGPVTNNQERVAAHGSVNEPSNGMSAPVGLIAPSLSANLLEPSPGHGVVTSTGVGGPLSRIVQDEPYPSNLHLPSLPEYYGTTDPEDHLCSFQILMPLIGASDATMCKIFPATLRGDARRWYSKLQDGIISSFFEFATLFRCKFYAQKKQPISIHQLLSIRQRDDETLKAYYTRYSNIAIGLTSISTEIATNALMRGTINTDLYASLAKRAPHSTMELQERVSKYIDLEEPLQEVSRAGSKRKQETSSQDSRRQRQAPALEGRNSSQNSKREDTQIQQSYTPLNRSRQAILQIIREKEIPITQPPPVMRVSGKGQQFYCEFHRCTGHDTESCYTLKHSIEGLIQRGYLRDFVKNIRPPILPSPPIIDKGKAPQESGSVLGNVPVIHGGVKLSEQVGSRSTGAPRLVGSASTTQIPISFDDRDLEDIEYPHDDALDIKAVIANYSVQRVLIDVEEALQIFYSTQLSSPWVFN